MDTIWIVVADQSQARFLSMTGMRGKPEELDTLEAPSGRQHDREMNADRPGRSFDSHGEGRHAMGKRNSPSEQAAIRFAEDIAELLTARHNEKAFQRLVLCAPPRFLGLLREALPRSVTRDVALTLNKDLTAVKAGEIREYLPEWF